MHDPNERDELYLNFSSVPLSIDNAYFSEFRGVRLAIDKGLVNLSTRTCQYLDRICILSIHHILSCLRLLYIA